MPRYEYECERCGPFEVTQRISDEPLTHHSCGAPAVRTISRTAFTLKGDGWYADGYGSGKPKKESSDSKSDSSSTSSDSSKKSESKSTTSTDSKPDTKPKSQAA